MSDSIRPYQCKGIANNGQVLIKDIDMQEGRVQGYFAIFGNVDSDGDMIMPGAFKKSLKENYTRIKHLFQHNPWQPLSSTKGSLTVKEDSKGLYFDSIISKTSWGKDALMLYADGVIDEHSIGYEVMKQRDHDTLTVERWGREEPVKELIELKLWEGSSVTWGANSQALATNLKSMNKDQIVERSNVLVKALRNGRYENEEVFDMLEIYLKQLQTSIITLSTSSTQADDESLEPPTGVKSDDESLFVIKNSLTKLKLKLI